MVVSSKIKAVIKNEFIKKKRVVSSEIKAVTKNECIMKE